MAFVPPASLCFRAPSSSAPSSASTRHPRRRRPSEPSAALSAPPPPALSRHERPSASNIVELSSVSALEALIASDPHKLLVVEAYSRSCRACIGMKRAYEHVASGNSSRARFARVSADDVPDVREYLDVRAMPFFVGYKGGGRIDHFASASRDRLEEFVEDNA